MCRAFSCIVTRSGRIIWEAGIDSHDKLISKYAIKDDTADGDLINFAKVEITPKNGYLHPEDGWILKVDEHTVPRWWNKDKEKAAFEAFEEWKTLVYSHINLEEARNLINPLKLKARKPTGKDIHLLKEWASVRDSVGDSVRASVRASVWDSVRASVGDSVGASDWDSVRASVWESVGDSVWAYIGSLFTGITNWKYVAKSEGYPYQSCVDLWKRGFIASFDGKYWRLHTGEDASIVFEIKKELLQEVK